MGVPGSVGPSGNKGPIVSYPSLFSWQLSLRYRCINNNNNDNNNNNNNNNNSNNIKLYLLKEQ